MCPATGEVSSVQNRAAVDIEALFALVDCPRCHAEGKVTVDREESHDLETCPLCRGDKQVPAVLVSQRENDDKLTREIVEAAASLADSDMDHGKWLVVRAYERAVYDARGVKALMDQVDQ